MLDSLPFSIGLLIADIALIWLLLRYTNRPIDPKRIPLVPRSVVMLGILLLLVGGLVIGAHIVSLVTGHQLQARRRRGM